MEERKAYFDLVSKNTVLLTEDELIENGAIRYISLGKWDKFLYENELNIKEDIERFTTDTKKVYYTVKSNTGAMSYNTYNTPESAYIAAAVNLYIEGRSKKWKYMMQFNG